MNIFPAGRRRVKSFGTGRDIPLRVALRAVVHDAGRFQTFSIGQSKELLL